MACIRSAEGGSAAVEFALTIPLVLAMLCGIIDFSRLAFSQAALHFAAEEATRFAVVREGQVDDEDIRAFAEERLLNVFGLGNATFDIDTTPDAVTGTNIITVVASQDFSFFLPFLPDGVLTLTSESRGFLAFPGGLAGGG